MKRISIYFVVVLLLAAGCSSSPDTIEAKREKLAELKNQAHDLNVEIKNLESEIAAVEGPSTNAILVNTTSIQPEPFSHSIEVRGNVASRTNVALAAETGGTIEQVRVVEGDRVNKGDILITLDNEVIKNNIAEVKTALDLADAVYKRQSNLWEKKIGTEIQYLEAKNRKEALERQLATLQSQLNKTIIRAPFSGTIDNVEGRVGEMAQPGMPLVKVVNQQQMYLEADVSERYIGDFKKGDKVKIFFPIQNKEIETTISAVSEVINLENRTFKIEMKMPKVDFTVKPNQVVRVELIDYQKDSTIVIPTEVILTDAEGKFIYVVSEKDNASVASKARIDVGMTNNGTTEVLNGLKAGDQVVVQGYRELTEGTIVQLTTKSTETAKL